MVQSDFCPKDSGCVASCNVCFSVVIMPDVNGGKGQIVILVKVS